jgi:hypothetical protein
MRNFHCLCLLASGALGACSNSATTVPQDSGAAVDAADASKTDASDSAASPKDPKTAAEVSIDRFSDTAGTLFKRSSNSALPAANAPINMDSGPFITHGFGPSGEHVTYYNFDVDPLTPAPIYVFFTSGATTEFPGQLHVVDVIPGVKGYNDFWQVVKVTVPADYVANSLASAAEIKASGYTTTPTNMLVNCPVVPKGSTAALRFKATESTATVQGWYRNQVVNYFSFGEATDPLTTDSNGDVPVIPIYVTFNIDPTASNAMSGPPSGFMTEPGTMQTHNVVDVLPTSSGYSPLWQVVVYPDAQFDSVSNLATAMAAATPPLVADAGDVNCPVVAIVSASDAGTDASAGD